MVYQQENSINVLPLSDGYQEVPTQEPTPEEVLKVFHHFFVKALRSANREAERYKTNLEKVKLSEQSESFTAQVEAAYRTGILEALKEYVIWQLSPLDGDLTCLGNWNFLAFAESHGHVFYYGIALKALAQAEGNKFLKEGVADAIYQQLKRQSKEEAMPALREEFQNIEKALSCE